MIPIGNTTSLAWSCAPGGAADFLSNMWLDYTGSTFGEQLGRGWMRAIHAEDIERLISTCDKIFQSGCAGNESARIKGADGAYRWFHFSAVPSKAGTGRVSKLYVTCVEIHDPTVECLMAAERSFLRVIAEGAAIDAALSDICSFLDKSGPDFCSIVLIDDEAKRLWTAPFGALSGARKNEIAPILIPSNTAPSAAAAGRGSLVFVSDIETDPLWAPKRLFALQHGLRAAWSQPLESKEGKLRGTLCIYLKELREPSEDNILLLKYAGEAVTIAIEREQSRLASNKALENLRISERQIRAMIDIIPTQIWWTYRDGSTEFQNRQWLDYAGLSLEDARGWGWKNAVHPDDQERYGRKWLEIMASKAPGEATARFRRFDGEYRWFLMRAVPAFDENGSIEKWYGSNTDIEELKRGEEALRNAQAELAHVSRLTTMGVFAGSIAHEVNQPLMAITANAAACLSWLNRAPPNYNKAKAATERVVRDGHRAGDILRSIRALATQTEPEITRFDLGDVVIETLDLLRPELRRHKILDQRTFDKGTASITGDRVQLQQVIMNLARNALEAMVLTEGTERVLTTSLVTDGREVIEVAIADTGTGFEPDMAEKMFEAFFSAKPGGMGLGLSICRSIIETHGGRLWATTNHPRGSVFRFSVPTTSLSR